MEEDRDRVRTGSTSRHGASAMAHRSYRRSCWLLLALLLFACGPSQRRSENAKAETGKEPPKASLRTMTPEQLLKESEDLEKQLDERPSSRASYLVDLCRISAEIRSPRIRDRCLNAFRFAGTQLRNCEGEKRQVQSLVALSEVNAVLAMNLFHEVEPWCERFGDPQPDDKVDRDSD